MGICVNKGKHKCTPVLFLVFYLWKKNLPFFIIIIFFPLHKCERPRLNQEQLSSEGALSYLRTLTVSFPLMSNMWFVFNSQNIVLFCRKKKRPNKIHVLVALKL